MEELELNLEEGISEAIKLVGEVTDRPILVGIYGLPDSGKSYIIDIIANHFENGVLSVKRRSEASTDFDEFEKIKRGDCRDLQIFHCAWDRARSYSCDPLLFLEMTSEMTAHLTVGVYNPSFQDRLEGKYDIVIRNPDSVIKAR